MRSTRLLIGVICVGLLMAAPGIATPPQTTHQPALQEGEWADACKNATVIESGVYNGTISPEDTDAFIIETASEGDYATLNLSFDGGAEVFQILNPQSEDGYSTPTYTAVNGGPIADAYDGASFHDHQYRPDVIDLEAQDEDGASVYSLRVYAEDSNAICFRFATDGRTAANWKMSVAVNEAEAPAVLCDDQEARTTTETNE